MTLESPPVKADILPKQSQPRWLVILNNGNNIACSSEGGSEEAIIEVARPANAMKFSNKCLRVYIYSL